LTHYTLKLSFDLRQVTQALAYDFVLAKDSTICHVERDGALAGTFNFQQNDELSVEVTATSALYPKEPDTAPKDILTDFTVTNCTFISIPAHMTGSLSMFNNANSSAAMGKKSKWGPISKNPDEEKNLQRLSRQSGKTLSVSAKNGQWKISGYLSVELTSADGTIRPVLYFFDPESSTGNGGGLN